MPRTTNLSDLLRRLRPWRGALSFRHTKDEVRLEVRTANFRRVVSVAAQAVTFAPDDLLLHAAEKLVSEISQAELARAQTSRLTAPRE